MKALRRRVPEVLLELHRVLITGDQLVAPGAVLAEQLVTAAQAEWMHFFGLFPLDDLVQIVQPHFVVVGAWHCSLIEIGHLVLLATQRQLALVTREMVHVPGLVLGLGAFLVEDQLLAQFTARLEEFEKVPRTVDAQLVRRQVVDDGAWVEVGTKIDENLAARHTL